MHGLRFAVLNVSVFCAVDSSTFPTGQRCTASSRDFATEGVHAQFQAAMVEKMNSIKVERAQGRH